MLENLAKIGKVDAYFEAIDSDDFEKTASLMNRADIDAEMIANVMKKMADADVEH